MGVRGSAGASRARRPAHSTRSARGECAGCRGGARLSTRRIAQTADGHIVVPASGAAAASSGRAGAAARAGSSAGGACSGAAPAQAAGGRAQAAGAHEEWKKKRSDTTESAPAATAAKRLCAARAYSSPKLAQRFAAGIKDGSGLSLPIRESGERSNAWRQHYRMATRWRLHRDLPRGNLRGHCERAWRRHRLLRQRRGKEKNRRQTAKTRER